MDGNNKKMRTQHIVVSHQSRQRFLYPLDYSKYHRNYLIHIEYQSVVGIDRGITSTLSSLENRHNILCLVSGRSIPDNLAKPR